jgi:hypothetical protein
MQTSNIVRAGCLAIILSLMVIVWWEIHLRNNGNVITYDDNGASWADKRGMVYEPSDKAIVFIGSSRMKYDLDIPTWQEITGTHAIQLSNVGSDPVPYLMDLADDKNFKGKIICGVTEEIFFSDVSPDDVTNDKNIKYFRKITPTQRFSFLVDHFLESKFVFLDQDNYSFNAMVDEMSINPRPGVFLFPIFPTDFDRNSFDRQSRMSPRFLADTNLQNEVKANWITLSKVMIGPPFSPGKLDSFVNTIKVASDKIKSRGGDVLFVRNPSSGVMLEGEQHGFPKAQYFDKLIAVTGCPGIFYTDYPGLSGFVCPEWSHLKPSDAIVYTKELIKIIEKDKGWIFNK